MAYTDNPFYSNNPGDTGSTVGIGSLDSTRRLFNFGDRVAELAPEQTPFFVYLSKVAKKATDDPTFKFLEQRHQWQRRNFEIGTTTTTAAASGGAIANHEIEVTCKYDKYGNTTTDDKAPLFLLDGQTIAIAAKYDSAGDGANANDSEVMVTARIHAQGTNTSSLAKPTIQILSVTKSNGQEQVLADDSKILYEDGDLGQVIGSSFAEATSFPDGWSDELYAREGYTQIFKTAMPLMSGSAQATRYRGIANEWQRVWREKLMEHKMDIEHAMLFGVGSNSTATHRQSWGIVPYAERYGKVYNIDWGNKSGGSLGQGDFDATYDGFLGMMENFFAPESGNSGQKLALASRSVITYMNRLQGFIGATQSTTLPFNIDVNYKDGKFGHKIMEVNTIYGTLNFVQEPLFRGPYDDMAVLIDMENLAYRPLQGNGINRDTFIETNVQSPGLDGRVDQILTEAGLEISLPETHAVMKFGNHS
tara:strand:+ start:1701 stop:3128 length:1428 start_codon:yes stop_codon:yes gene_type:complete